MECLHQTLSARLKELCKTEVTKILRAESVDNIKETVSSRHNRTNVHINSQRLRLLVQGLHKVKSYKVPVLKLGREHELPLLTKKLSLIDNYSLRNKQFLP